MKLCLDCRVCKPLSSFSKNCRKKDGLDSYCKICVGIRSAAHHKKNAAKRREQTKAWLARNPGKNAEYSERWRQKNPGGQAKADREWYRENRARKLAADKARRERRLEEFLARERASYQKHRVSRAARLLRWRKRNPEKIRKYATDRRSAKTQRTPPWLTLEDHEAILAFYVESVRRENETGLPHHVDHVVPLRGRKVSGLHVPWNLQVLPKVENLKKSNRHA